MPLLSSNGIGGRNTTGDYEKSRGSSALAIRHRRNYAGRCSRVGILSTRAILAPDSADYGHHNHQGDQQRREYPYEYGSASRIAAKGRKRRRHRHMEETRTSVIRGQRLR